MGQEEIIGQVREAVAADPRKAQIRSVYLFGSFLHGDAKDGSDVDLLFEMGETMSMFSILGIQQRLEKRVGRKVDLVEKGSLDPYIKDAVLAEAKQIV